MIAGTAANPGIADFGLEGVFSGDVVGVDSAESVVYSVASVSEGVGGVVTTGGYPADELPDELDVPPLSDDSGVDVGSGSAVRSSNCISFSVKSLIPVPITLKVIDARRPGSVAPPTLSSEPVLVST